MRKNSLFLGIVALAGMLVVGGKASANSIVNGDFSAGSTGFTTGYIEDSSAGAGANAGTQQGAGYYGIVTSSQFWHPSFVDFGDHTTGTGNMMIVNADSLGTTTVWQESGIDVTPSALYRLEFWARSAYPVSPASLVIGATINALDQTFNLSGDTSAWQHFSVDFVAQSSPTTISIIDTNTELNGNDFAIDDISLTQLERNVPGPAVPLPSSALGGGVLLSCLAFLKKSRRQEA